LIPVYIYVGGPAGAGIIVIKGLGGIPNSGLLPELANYFAI
jgi:hypothetical protein